MRSALTESLMNYYDILRVGKAASQAEIDRAYQIRVKESSLDRRINRPDIEAAYGTLKDPTRRAHYDHRLDEEKKRLEIVAKSDRKESWRKLFFKFLRFSAVTIILVAVGFAYFRYGFYLKSFEIGDDLFYQDTHDYLGVVMDFQPDHSFGRAIRNGILIKKLDGTELWFPLNQVKACCYTSDHPGSGN
jgi:curved DNA-binding protein CbpA